jgi:hypothetical protein
MTTRNLPRGKVRPARKAGNLTAIVSPTKCGILEVSQSYKLPRPVTGIALLPSIECRNVVNRLQPPGCFHIRHLLTPSSPIRPFPGEFRSVFKCPVINQSEYINIRNLLDAPSLYLQSNNSNAVRPNCTAYTLQ